MRIRRRRHREQLRLAREVSTLTREMTEAQATGDLDTEYRLLHLISLKASELEQLRSS